MFTNVDWDVAHWSGDKSPLAHGSLGYGPGLGGSSELCDPREPRPQAVLEPPVGGTGPQVGRLEPAGFRVALGRLGALSDTTRVPARWWHWIGHLDDTGPWRCRCWPRLSAGRQGGERR
jgi:hypothetical protein